LALSALKRCEHRGSLVLRIFNPTAKALTAKITCAQPLRAAYLCNLNEERRQKLQPAAHSVAFPVPKKKIMTVELVLAARALPRARRGK
jgi:alpha-mannosidase